MGLQTNMARPISENVMKRGIEFVFRRLARAYLALFDATMRLGPMRGAAVLTFGPFVVASLAFIAKVSWLDPMLDSTLTTAAVFVVFALLGPLMNTGSKLLAEGWHKARFGRYPGQWDFRIDPKTQPSPTLLWVKAVRDWAE